MELAGYGRESTHKGYLTWLLNTWHWSKAREGLISLVEAAGDGWPDDGRGKAEWIQKATDWIQQCPKEFYCEYERRVGRGKVDLLVKAGNGGTYDLPIELKTGGATSESQLRRMSVDRKHGIGLVLRLGSSAVRDDGMPENQANWGCFAPLTVSNILDVWEEMKGDMPQAGRDWLEALEHERLRLNGAFDLSSEDREHVYRNRKHMFYALLHSVRKVLHDEHDKLGAWRLYDGGYNTVLNLRGDSEWSWNKVAGSNAEAYWEFNDCNLVLKVKQCGVDEITRDWIEKTQKKIQNLKLPCMVKSKKPKKARAGSKWISVWRWDLPFDTAHDVAERSVEIIRETSKSLPDMAVNRP